MKEVEPGDIVQWGVNRGYFVRALNDKRCVCTALDGHKYEVAVNRLRLYARPVSNGFRLFDTKSGAEFGFATTREEMSEMQFKNTVRL